MFRTWLFSAAALVAACATPARVTAPSEDKPDRRPDRNTFVLTLETPDPKLRVERLEPRVDGADATRKVPLSPGEHEIEVTLSLDADGDSLTLTTRGRAMSVQGIVYATATVTPVAGRVEFTLKPLADRRVFLPPNPPGGRFARSISPLDTPRVDIDAVHELRGTNGKYGNVILCLDESGGVRSVTFGTYTVPSFDAAIVQTVRNWKFAPAETATGERAAACFPYRFNVIPG